MLKKSVIVAALAAAFAGTFTTPLASARETRESKELAEIREQVRQMKQAYETRLAALEERLAQAQAQAAAAQGEAKTAMAAAQQADRQHGAAASAAAAVEPVAPAPAAPLPASAQARSNAFNPDISAILGGSFQRLKQDPEQYKVQGMLPAGGETGPGAKGFSLGESEITLRANIDPTFSGQVTFALTPENEAEVEEAFIQTRDLGGGFNVKAGRFLSAIGYLNSQHSHTWDFADAPLAYQVFLGGQYKSDGIQAKWLAPLDQFVELGVELGNGENFPGTGRNKNGANSVAAFARLGDDIGDSSSYRVGVSLLRTRAQQRGWEEEGLQHAFSGKTSTFIADAIYKWAPQGNSTVTNFKLQGEYFRSKDSGTLDYDTGIPGGPLGRAYSGAYVGKQSGWYLQGVYQFMPNWRAGLRYDRLATGARNIALVDDGTLDAGSFGILAPYSPRKTSLMFDYSPSEFSRLRLQFAQDKSRPGATDNQVILQYIMSLGTHAAHAF